MNENEFGRVFQSPPNTALSATEGLKADLVGLGLVSRGFQVGDSPSDFLALAQSTRHLNTQVGYLGDFKTDVGRKLETAQRIKGSWFFDDSSRYGACQDAERYVYGSVTGTITHPNIVFTDEEGEITGFIKSRGEPTFVGLVDRIDEGKIAGSLSAARTPVFKALKQVRNCLEAKTVIMPDTTLKDLKVIRLLTSAFPDEALGEVSRFTGGDYLRNMTVGFLRTRVEELVLGRDVIRFDETDTFSILRAYAGSTGLERSDNKYQVYRRLDSLN